MAFPSSPSNGDLFKNYMYSTTVSGWQKYSEGTFTLTLDSQDTAGGNIVSIDSQECRYQRNGKLLHVAGNMSFTGSGVITQGDEVVYSGLPFPVRRMNSEHRSLGIMNYYQSHGTSDNALGDVLITTSKDRLHSEILVVDGSPDWGTVKATFDFIYETE